MSRFVGRVSLKHLADPEDSARAACLRFAAETGVEASCFVFEMGSINEEPHLHFYFETRKSRSTIERILKIVFELPPKVCAL